ncbi:hypothetical protein ACROYT_G027367 [Oculina patagonica]
MDSEGIRLAPKPAPQLSTALFTSPLLDLTPEKKTSRPKQNISVDPIENKTEESKEIYACLAQPSINSTKRVSRKLQALQMEQFDAAAAIAEELEQSETARINLGEKVAQAVNVKKGSHIYSDLVSLDVNAKDVLAECAYPKARSSTKTNKPLAQEPDIMAFFSEDFETQTAHFDYDLFYKEDPLPGPSAAPISHVFDLYEHIQCWQQQ